MNGMLIKDPFGIHGIKGLVQDTREALDYRRFTLDSPAWVGKVNFKWGGVCTGSVALD